MKLKVLETEDKEKNLAFVELSHNGQSSVWNVQVYDRSKFVNIDTFFDEINRYWEKLPPEQQDMIWAIYGEIRANMESLTDFERLHTRLKNLVKVLYDLHDLKGIERSVRFYGDVKIPNTMKSEYDEKDIIPRTYLRDDYFDLIILTIALRPMLPIFGEYIERIKKGTGNNFKEQYAFGLLSGSYIYNCPAMERLRVYVNATVEQESVSTSAILQGLGTDELPLWLLSKSVVRRVVTGEVNIIDNTSSIISNVHHFIKSKIGSMDRDFKGKVSRKNNPKDGAQDEDNISLVETYKVKQEVSDGDVVMLSVYTEQVIPMALRVDPEVDLNKIEIATKHAIKKETMEIRPHHLTLTQWVLHKAISARGIPALNKPALLRAIGVAQGLLWDWGFEDLAVLLTAAPYVPQDEGYMTSSDSRARIPKEQLDELVERYPHYQRVSSKMQNERQANVAAKAIDILTKELIKNDWVVTGPKQLIEGRVTVGNNIMIVPPDIKHQLSSLLLKIT